MGVSSAAEPLPYVSQTPSSRVVISQDASATEAFKPRPEVVRSMFNQALTNLTGSTNAAQAWQGLVSTRDVVGIKVFSAPGPNSGTRAVVVAPIIEGLLAAGVPPDNIIVWDRQITDLRLAGFSDLAERYKIRLAGAVQEGFDPNVFYDTPLLGNLVYGDLEFGKQDQVVGRKSFVTKLLTRKITKIINVNPLLNHNLAGVCGNLYSLAMSSIDNAIRFESDTGRLATAVPEIYALTNLSDHVVLNIVDALICQYEGGEKSLLHYSTALNQIRMSRDPVALDVLSLKELDRQRLGARAPDVKPNLELYNNASLLELGQSNFDRIRVELLRTTPASGRDQAQNGKSLSAP